MRSDEISELGEDELSRRWRREGKQYAAAVNARVARALSSETENADLVDEPKDGRQPMAKAVLKALRQSNQTGFSERFRKKFPPAYHPFVQMLDENGQSIPVAFLLDDGRILARIGAVYEEGRVVIIDGREVQSLDPDVISVGRSPNRGYFAVANRSGIRVHQGWDGPVTKSLSWPTRNERIPQFAKLKRINGAPVIRCLIPFDTGDRVLLVSPEGIFVISAAGAARLMPAANEMELLPLRMEHAAISFDGRFIACGHQDSSHCVYDAESLKPVGKIGNLSDYPLNAIFSGDGKSIALNSCHLYSGITIGVPLALLPGLETPQFEPDERMVEFEANRAVYAGVSHGNEFIFGDFYGYLQGFGATGKFRWQHFIGSSIDGIDVSRDGRQIIVTTCAGFLCLIDLNTGVADPFTIGTATHQERRRWLFWKLEHKPLIW